MSVVKVQEYVTMATATTLMVVSPAPVTPGTSG